MNWPVNVEVDFPILLEQLSEIIGALEDEAECELDFYERGVERLLTFVPRGTVYVVHCKSLTSWVPVPSVEEIDQARLKAMLEAVRDNFMATRSSVAPELTAHPWVIAWMRGG